jgi:hypothetical protein
MPEKQLPPGMELIPPLYAPEGVTLQASGMGGGPFGRWTSEATAVTQLGTSELEAHFAAQLRAAGWTRFAGRADGPLAWSTWQVPGAGGWQGFLFALEAPGEKRRSLHVRVESAGA